MSAPVPPEVSPRASSSLAPSPAHASRPSGGRGTALTLGGFFATMLALSTSPGVPVAWRPLDASSSGALAALATRVVQKPATTLAEHERAMAGDDAIPIDDDDTGDDVPARRPAPVRPSAAPGPATVAVDRALLAEAALQLDDERRAAVRTALQMPGSLVENPCIARAAGDTGACVRTALDPLFDTFDALARGDAQARADVVVFGNSLIASDHVVDVVRERLVALFGDGGRGLLLPERLSKVAGRRVRTGRGTEGWEARTLVDDRASGSSPPPATATSDTGSVVPLFGITGSLHEATTNNETTSWEIDGAARARLFWLDNGRELRLDVDGHEVLHVPPTATATPRARTAEVKVPPNAQALRLVAARGARVYGVALERSRGGVLVDTIGVPAASARAYLDDTDTEVFQAQLALRDPSLVVFMLGGNETRAFALGGLDETKFAAKLGGLVERARAVAPRAGCLIVTPIDAVATTTSGDELVTRKEIHRVIATQRRVAVEHGCALFDLFAAMGGAGSFARMHAASLTSTDLVHPNHRGGDVLGDLFARALLIAWRDTAPSTLPDVHTRRVDDPLRPRFVGLSFPEEERVSAVVVDRAGGVDDDHASGVAERPRALARFFARLTALEQGTRRRVAIGQFGASHTAGQSMTDRMRQRLGARFGEAGRGFVSVGTASKRLQPSGVVRALEGPFDIADGTEVNHGGVFNLAGTKARLLPGGGFRVAFCTGCPRASSPTSGRLELAWLFTPDMGTADVLLDGERVATLSPAARRKDSDVQFLSLPVTQEHAVLDVVAREAGEATTTDRGDDDELTPVGPVHLLSVVEEMDRPGVVLDAMGLPGSTGMTPQRWRQDVMAEQIARRNYDLIITAWGTNEAGLTSLDDSTYRQLFGQTLDTLRFAAPDADCLVIGASDRFNKRNQGWVPAPHHDLVEVEQRALAAERGCAFFSLRDFMGGAGSMKRWIADGLANEDHVHFKRAGYEKIADAFVDELLAAWTWSASDPRRAADDDDDDDDDDNDDGDDDEDAAGAAVGEPVAVAPSSSDTPAPLNGEGH